ncbi:MAG: hypothetical protein WAZ27_02140 [Minisyncoccia bacterium]
MISLATKAPRILLAIGCVLAIGVTFFITPRETYSQTTVPMTGYAWSDTMGWISFNCSDLGTCGSSTYGLSIAVDGTISGYAWSEYMGWISANSADLSGCPTAPCTALMNGNSMEGWMKALAADQAQSGGWDGFISLSGTNYGPTLSSGTFSGYAWGDMNIGWVSFNSGLHSAQTAWVPCTPSYACTSDTTRDDLCTVPVENISCGVGLVCLTGLCGLPAEPSTSFGDELTAEPRLIRAGQTILLSWNVADATTCAVTGGGLNLSGESSASATCTHSGDACVSNVINSQTTFTLSCTGPGGELTPSQTATVYLNPAWKEI